MLHQQAYEFFSELLAGRLEEPVYKYVISVMVDYVQISLSSEPLCLKLGQMTVRRVLVLKEVGDQALLVSGFLRGPEPRYYAQLGSSAYGELSTRIRDPLFRKMSSDFTFIQNALREARRDCDLQGTDYQVLVREWVQSRSSESEKSLESLGLLLPHKIS